MYHLSYFKSSNGSALIQLMKTYPFATLIGAHNGTPVATQVPVLVEERADGLYLTGHIMRKQDHHLAFLENPKALFLFSGPHAYISASWYPQPAQASTWNYLTVHARGEMKFLDENGLMEVLQKLSLHFESDSSQATVYNNLSDTYKLPLLKAIIAFEMKVDDLQHVFKLSQNKDEQTFNAIVERLEAGSEEEVKLAAFMKAERHGN
ncbi:MAG: FMN-binding negative transcriptional regulator [Chitinophagaceae bacterium]|nr:FMN-binding negative transcriptional regulator [Chitinophagaceae bacterium]